MNGSRVAGGTEHYDGCRGLTCPCYLDGQARAAEAIRLIENLVAAREASTHEATSAEGWMNLGYYLDQCRVLIAAFVPSGEGTP